MERAHSCQFQHFCQCITLKPCPIYIRSVHPSMCVLHYMYIDDPINRMCLQNWFQALYFVWVYLSVQHTTEFQFWRKKLLHLYLYVTHMYIKQKYWTKCTIKMSICEQCTCAAVRPRQMLYATNYPNFRALLPLISILVFCFFFVFCISSFAHFPQRLYKEELRAIMKLKLFFLVNWNKKCNFYSLLLCRLANNSNFFCFPLNGTFLRFWGILYTWIYPSLSHCIGILFLSVYQVKIYGEYYFENPSFYFGNFIWKKNSFFTLYLGNLCRKH